MLSGIELFANELQQCQPEDVANMVSVNYLDELTS